MENQPFQDMLGAATDRWKRLNRHIHLLICLVGLVVVAAVGFGFYLGARVYQKHFPLIDASMEMRLEATNAYLWFEEMIGGDPDITMDRILRHLDQARWYAHAMLYGGKSGHLQLSPYGGSQFRQRLQSIQQLLEDQRILLEKRQAATGQAGPGSDIDHLYHSKLDKFLSQANQLEMDIKSVMVRDYQVFQTISFGIIGFCTLLFILVGYGFYRYERLRRRNDANMLQMHRMMVQNEKMVSLGMMISGIAHEVNNPNNFISFNLPILKEYLQEILPIIDDYAARHPEFEVYDMPYDEFRKDLQRLMQNIENGSRRIDGIVSDLKAFSRKKEKIKIERVDLKEVIRRTETICGSKIKTMVKSFDIHLPAEPLETDCDAEVVELILVNFLINAAEAADKENSWVALKVQSVVQKPRRLIIEVSDNGAGVRHHDVSRIFEPFFSTKSSQGGTGMGLYLCRTLAEQMDANIEVQSTVGQGTVFRLIIPEQAIPG